VKSRGHFSQAGVLAAAIIAAAVAVACNSDKKEAEAAVKQAAALAESGKPADLDEADKLLGEALKKDPGNPGIPPVAERIKAQRAGTVKAKGPPVASKADCDAACGNHEELGCKQLRAILDDKDTDADMKTAAQAELKTDCDAHGSRASCTEICTRVWSPENAACVKAARTKDEIDKCVKSKLRHMPKTQDAWAKKVLTPAGFAAVQAE
jgi:hypothetical protein